MIRRNRRKCLNDIEVLPSEECIFENFFGECITQRKSLVCDFVIRRVKDTRRKSVPRRKTWKLHEGSVKNDFWSYINQYRASSQKDTSAEDFCNNLKRALLKATGRSFGWTKGPARK